MKNQNTNYLSPGVYICWAMMKLDRRAGWNTTAKAATLDRLLSECCPEFTPEKAYEFYRAIIRPGGKPVSSPTAAAGPVQVDGEGEKMQLRIEIKSRGEVVAQVLARPDISDGDIATMLEDVEQDLRWCVIRDTETRTIRTD